jgi:hypothetical protein
MRRSTLTAAILATTLAVAPAGALRAQGLLSAGLGGGVALPLSTFSDEVVPGFRVLGTVALGVPLLPLGLRLDAAYDRFDVERALEGAPVSAGAPQVFYVTLNPTYRLPSAGAPITPYLIGGAGSYNVGCAGGLSCESATNFGWNGGAGFRFRLWGLGAFAEARYHRVSASGGSLQYVPVIAGLLF